MKSAFFLPFALLLGLVIGGWVPKEELRATKRQVAELTAKLAASDKASGLDAFTRMIKIPERAKSPSSNAPTPKPAPAPPRLALAITTDAPAVAQATVSNAAGGEAASPARSAPEDLRARIDEAKALWLTRVDLSRAQWMDRLRLKPDESARFDEALNTMNENLYNAMQRLADNLAGTETLTPEEGVRALNEMTSALVTAYDDIATAVPDAKRGEASKIELTDFIDPAVAEPLVAVQDKLQNLPRERRPGIRMGFRR